VLLPPVVVDISAESSTPALVQTLLAACSEAVLETDCVLDSEAEAGPPSAVAIVSFGDELTVRVEVGVRFESGQEWRARELRFAASDEVLERWRATGFAIGTLTGELREAEAAEQRVSPPAPGVAASASATAAPAPASSGVKDETPLDRATSEPPQKLRYWSAFGLVFGPGFRDGPWRVGGSARIGVAPARWPAHTSAAFSYAARPLGDDSVRAEWMTFSAGFGLPVVTSQRFEAVIALEASLQRLVVSADVDGSRDSGSRWLGAGGGALQLELGLAAGVAVFGRAQLDVLGGTTDVALAGRRVATNPLLAPTGSLGVRLEPQ
jgi:hypothetical protein